MINLQPVFTSMKVANILKTKDPKQKIVKEQCAVYHFKWGLCNKDLRVSLLDTYISASANTSNLKFVDRNVHEGTRGREINPAGQFFGAQKMQK